MKTRSSAIAGAVITFAAIFTGCSSPSAPQNDRDAIRMKVVGILYAQCMKSNRGVAPANQDQFVAFIQREPANWNKIAPTPQGLLTSQRDGQPLVVLYGAAVKDPPDGGFPWIAHEQTGVEGKQFAVNARGNVVLKDSQEIAQLFPRS